MGVNEGRDSPAARGPAPVLAALSHPSPTELATQRLGMITAAIADAISADEVYEAVVDQVARVLGASSAGLFLIDEASAQVRAARLLGYSEVARRQLAVVPLEARAPVVDCARLAAPVWVDSQAELFARYPHLEAVATAGRSYRIACLPVVVQGKTLGSLGFTFDDAPPLDEEQRALLQQTVQHAAQALGRLRLLDSEQKNRARAEASAGRLGLLSRASRALSEVGHDIPALLQTIVDQLGLGFADGAEITLFPEGGDKLVIAAHRDRDPAIETELRAAVSRAPFDPREGISGDILRTGKTLWVPQVDLAVLLATVHPSQRAWTERAGPRTMVVAPLRGRGRIIGTLSAMRRQGLPFDLDDKLLVEELAERAGLALEASRLDHDNRQARVRAELLYGLAASVNSAERVEQVFDVALDGIGDALGAKRSSVLVFDAAGVMRFRAWRGLSDTYRQAVEGHSPWTKESRAPQAILIPDVRLDPSVAGLLPVFTAEGIASVGFIPLVAGGKLLGKFMVYFDRPVTLAPHELEMARAIANHVAAAVGRFEAMARLRETVHYNELFAGVLAHDLRNPLAAILTAAQLVLRLQEGEGDKTRKPMNRIITSGERMTRMVDQLLDFTRARVGGGFNLDPLEADLFELARQVIDELEISRPEWKVVISCVGDPIGSWDPDRLAQVISNLVANAGQHGEAGAPLQVRLDGAHPDFVTLEVKNRGAIPEALRPSLFDPFRRAGQHRARTFGLGLGLYITRELVVAHGGTVTVSSGEPEGTSILIRLPRRAQPRSRTDAGV